MGLLTQLIEAEFGITTRHVSRVVSVGTTAVTILPNNDDRLSAVIMNLGTSPAYINPGDAVSAANGIRLSANGGGYVMNWKDDMVLPGLQWLAIDPTASVNVLVVEVIGLGEVNGGPLGV